jgi:aldose 1-epimerase
MQAAPAGCKGYDHCFVVNRKSANELAMAAKVRDPKSGRTMTVYTTQPGVQVYTSNHFNGQPGSGGFDKHGAICLETQHYPDSPNRPEFPTTLLKPGETMSHKTVHKFSVE